VLVPGPGDLGPGSSLPRPGLPQAVAAALSAAVPNAVLASNPCRVRHGGSEVVLFRDDLQQKMRGLAILPPPAGDEAPLFEHVCATVLQQSHLCPVPLEYQVGLLVVEVKG
jgi:DNA polymerase epsilon subunit 2